MKKNINDPLESILKDTFDNYEVPEYKNSWHSINSKVVKYQFFKFSFVKFNAYYIVAITGALIIGTTLFLNSKDKNSVSTAIIPVETILPIISKDSTISNNEMKEIKINQIEETSTYRNSNSTKATASNGIDKSKAVQAITNNSDTTTLQLVRMPIDTVSDKTDDTQLIDTVSIQKPIKKKIKKTVYVNEQIVVKDTIVKTKMKRTKDNN